MTLELLICTIDEGIERLKDSLCPLPSRDDVHYLVSWQYTTPELPRVPEWLSVRTDVTILQLQEKGLCKNRNFALEHATGDILKICDDDERWTLEYFDTILDTYRNHPEYDIVHFQAIGPTKKYPPRFVSSFEITMQREKIGRLRFDERFGLGSDYLNAGEEDVLMYDALRMGLHIHYEPQPICQTRANTTGDNISNPLLQRSKGAVFYRTGGYGYACYKAVRETLGWMLRKGMNPITMLRNMWWGINYIRTWQP